MFRSFLTLETQDRVPKVFLAKLSFKLFSSEYIRLLLYFVAFLTKTVSEGVHDGKDEVEAVADVERDQDVVEAVSHFSPKYLIVEYLNMTYISI